MRWEGSSWPSSSEALAAVYFSQQMRKIAQLARKNKLHRRHAWKWRKKSARAGLGHTIHRSRYRMP